MRWWWKVRCPRRKTARLEEFQDGKHRVLITKPKIAGSMNFQHCARMVFVGLSGQLRGVLPVHPPLLSVRANAPGRGDCSVDAEEAIYHNVMQKELEAQTMSQKLIEQVQAYERAEIAAAPAHQAYTTNDAAGVDWRLMLGDSAERMGSW